MAEKKKSGVSKAIKNRKAVPGKMESECLIQILGTNNGYHYFISPLGELRKIHETQMHEAALQGLFGGKIQWLQKYFPAEAHKGKTKTGAEFNVSMARNHLIQRCNEQGLFDETAPKRSIGVWKDKLSNKPIIHCGDKIMKNNKWIKSGFYEEGIIYPAEPSISKPADEPATLEECREILDGLKLWNFELAQGPEIALGLLGQSFIAGALDWKAHSLFYGPQGTGKTTLARFMSAALGPMAHPPANNFTEAGLRQSMSNQARAVLLDEMEADGTHGTMKAVVRMMRQMSSGEGANIRRGTPGGHAQSFRLNGSVMMFCILPPHMEPQDRARITRLKLLPLKSPADMTDNFGVEHLIRRTKDLAPKLWRRAIDRLDHFTSACSTYKSYLTMNEGLSSRAADQISTILAGMDIILFDGPPEDTDSREERIEIIRPLIDEWTVDEEENEGEQCLVKLYSSPLNVYSRDENKTIGSIILEALDSQNGQFARDALKQTGILVKDFHTQEPYILIANNHEGLHRVFRGSKWEGGGWITALRYLPGTGVTKNAVRFAGTQVRATIVLHHHLPLKGE